MNNVKQSLTRKLGPLPVWAWALIFGAALYIYRSRKALTGGASSALTSATDTSTGTGTGSGGTPADPVTLQPGESVYDPNTGQLLGASPGQQAPTPPGDPIPIDPGFGVYDPGDPGAGVRTAPPTIKPPTKQRRKPPHRTPKPKGGARKHKSVRKPTHGKSRNRSAAKLLDTVRRKARPQTRAKTKTRGKPATPKNRTRTPVKTVPTPAIRQRTAAPKIVHPDTQRVAPHPATHHAKKRSR